MLINSSMIDFCYLISHGFAARMIIQTDLLGKLARKGFSVGVVTPDTTDKVLADYCEAANIQLWGYNPKTGRWEGEYLRLRKYLFENVRRNPALREKHLREKINSKKSRSFGRIRPYLYLAVHDFLQVAPWIRKIFVRMERQLLKDKKSGELLNHISPRWLISTYPVNLLEGRLLQQANDRKGTKTIIHLLSWDNITCKGRFPAFADKYICWGEIMSGELKSYYGVRDEDIAVCGVPHFDLHVEVSKRMSDAAGSGKKYLFFAMSSPYFAPHEIDIVEWLASEINKGRWDKLEMIVRPHPQNVVGEMADLTWIDRLKAIESDSTKVDWPRLTNSNLKWSMQKHDMEKLSELIASSTISVNSGSTVSIDSLMLAKPVILTMFDADKELPWWKSVKRVIEFPHIDTLIKTGGLTVVKNYESLTRAIDLYLSDLTYNLEGRKAAIQKECLSTDGLSTERVVDVLSAL